MIVGPINDVHRQQIVAQIVDKHGGLPIIVITNNPALGVVVGVMQQGAFAVANVAEPAEVLMSTLHSAAVKGRQSASQRQHLADLRVRMAQLTKPERQVLDAMLGGMANKQIAQALQIGLRTVELRRSKIMRKMNARSLAELIKFICTVMPAETAQPPAKAEPSLEQV